MNIIEPNTINSQIYPCQTWQDMQELENCILQDICTGQDMKQLRYINKSEENDQN